MQLDGDAAQQLATRQVLFLVLDGTLRLLHPFMPFVTEAAWQHLYAPLPAAERPAALIVAPFPVSDPAAIDPTAERDWTLLQDIVRGIRNLRSERGVEAHRWIAALISAGDRAAVLEAERGTISKLARVALDQLVIADRITTPPAQTTSFVIGAVEVFLPLAGMVDLEEERARLQKAHERAAADVERRRAKLGNESFTAKAPAAVVAKERATLADVEATVAALAAQLAALG